MPTEPRKCIYLAGPDVFLPDAKAIGKAKAEAVAAAGFVGLFPLDESPDLEGLTKHEQARRIARTCEAMMRRADLALANLTPFRGVSMDAGTAYEVGFMRALGKPVLGYSNVSGDYKSRALAFRARGIPPGDCDAADIELEDFALPENLMIAAAVLESGGHVVERTVAPGDELRSLDAFRICLEQAKRLFGG